MHQISGKAAPAAGSAADRTVPTETDPGPGIGRRGTDAEMRKGQGVSIMNTKTLFYILKRIGLAILTIWVVITVTFFVMHAVPGGPFMSEKAISIMIYYLLFKSQ